MAGSTAAVVRVVWRLGELLDMRCFSAHCSSVLRNITLSADDKLIQAARDRAHHERTTLNTLFRDWLRRYATVGRDEESYEKIMSSFKHVSTRRRFTRDEMNER